MGPQRLIPPTPGCREWVQAGTCRSDSRTWGGGTRREDQKDLGVPAPPVSRAAPGPRHSPAAVPATQEPRHDETWAEVGSCLRACPLPHGAMAGGGQRDTGGGRQAQKPPGAARDMPWACGPAQGGGAEPPWAWGPPAGTAPLAPGKGLGAPSSENPVGVCSGLVAGS